jgi:hypothetical protein
LAWLIFWAPNKELGPARLRGETVQGKPDSDLYLGVVLLDPPWITGRDKGCGNACKTASHPSSPPCAGISYCWKKKTPTSDTPPSGVCRSMASMRILTAGIAARS